MQIGGAIASSPAEHLRRHPPAGPVVFFCPEVLQRTARRFLEGFPGFVTYAVKANPDDAVIENLAAAGIVGFDVASPDEIRRVRRIVPRAVLHYHNPVRSRSEIEEGVKAGVASWSVDSDSELRKLFELVPSGTADIAVRFKLPVKGGAYDFGAKFGASPDHAATLLAAVAAHGFRPSLTFHPGTQCLNPEAWAAYIGAAAAIARGAGVHLARLNVGGGFPARRDAGEEPALERIFDRIRECSHATFGASAPALVCEPGRGLVAECQSLAARVKAVRDGEHVFLDDGTYGALSETPLMGVVGRIETLSQAGATRTGAVRPRTVFGPTCDSIDRLPGLVPLPDDLEEGDWLIFHGMGAYSAVTATRFNGFGEITQAMVLSLSG